MMGTGWVFSVQLHDSGGDLDIRLKEPSRSSIWQGRVLILALLAVMAVRGTHISVEGHFNVSAPLKKMNCLKHCHRCGAPSSSLM